MCGVRRVAYSVVRADGGDRGMQPMITANLARRGALKEMSDRSERATQRVLQERRNPGWTRVHRGARAHRAHQREVSSLHRTSPHVDDGSGCRPITHRRPNCYGEEQLKDQGHRVSPSIQSSCSTPALSALWDQGDSSIYSCGGRPTLTFAGTNRCTSKQLQLGLEAGRQRWVVIGHPPGKAYSAWSPTLKRELGHIPRIPL